MRGGWRVNAPGYAFGDASISAAQNLGQQQNVLTATANGTAFAGGVQVDSDVTQHGDNLIVRR